MLEKTRPVRLFCRLMVNGNLSYSPDRTVCPTTGQRSQPPAHQSPYPAIGSCKDLTGQFIPMLSIRFPVTPAGAGRQPYWLLSSNGHDC